MLEQVSITRQQKIEQLIALRGYDPEIYLATLQELYGFPDNFLEVIDKDEYLGRVAESLGLNHFVLEMTFENPQTLFSTVRTDYFEKSLKITRKRIEKEIIFLVQKGGFKKGNYSNYLEEINIPLLKRLSRKVKEKHAEEELYNCFFIAVKEYKGQDLLFKITFEEEIIVKLLGEKNSLLKEPLYRIKESLEYFKNYT